MTRVETVIPKSTQNRAHEWLSAMLISWMPRDEGSDTITHRLNSHKSEGDNLLTATFVASCLPHFLEVTNAISKSRDRVIRFMYEVVMVSPIHILELSRDWKDRYLSGSIIHGPWSHNGRRPSCVLREGYKPRH